MWPSIISVVGKGLNAFFGFKQSQGEAITTAISAVQGMSDSDANYAAASSQAISNVYSSGPLIERLWRPTLMWVIMFLVVGRWCGWHVLAALPEAEMMRLYDWLEIGLIGYIPLRTVEKMMRGFQVGSVLKTFISKKMS